MQEIKSVIDKNSKIAVLCGGMSSEAEVSMRSGKGCYDALQRLGYKNAEMVVVDNLSFEKPSTKEAAGILKALELNGRVTLVIGDEDVNTYLSFRNIPEVRVLGVSEANTYDFIDNKALVFTSAALSRIEEVLA